MLLDATHLQREPQRRLRARRRADRDPRDPDQPRDRPALTRRLRDRSHERPALPDRRRALPDRRSQPLRADLRRGRRRPRRRRARPRDGHDLHRQRRAAARSRSSTRRIAAPRRRRSRPVSRPQDVAVDPGTRTLYVANFGEEDGPSNVSVIDTRACNARVISGCGADAARRSRAAAGRSRSASTPSPTPSTPPTSFHAHGRGARAGRTRAPRFSRYRVLPDRRAARRRQTLYVTSAFDRTLDGGAAGFDPRRRLRWRYRFEQLECGRLGGGDEHLATRPARAAGRTLRGRRLRRRRRPRGRSRRGRGPRRCRAPHRRRALLRRR